MMSHENACADTNHGRLGGKRTVREHEAAQSQAEIPIIALTANHREGDRNRCLLAGMNDFIVKPVSREALLKAFKSIQRQLAN